MGKKIKGKTQTNSVVEGVAPHSPNRIVGFDCATNTGVAINNFGAITKAFSINVSKCQTIGTKLAKFQTAVENTLREAGPDLVVVEEPHLRGRGSFLTVGLYTTVLKVASQLGLPVASCHTQTLKSFCGCAQRGAGKDPMVALAKKYYPVSNDDEADAVHLTRWAASNFGGWSL